MFSTAPPRAVQKAATPRRREFRRGGSQVATPARVQATTAANLRTGCLTRIRFEKGSDRRGSTEWDSNSESPLQGRALGIEIKRVLLRRWACSGSLFVHLNPPRHPSRQPPPRATTPGTPCFSPFFAVSRDRPLSRGFFSRPLFTTEL